MTVNKILFNGQVHTLDPLNPRCSAIAISRNRIFAAGSNEAVLDLADKSTEKIDLDGRCG